MNDTVILDVGGNVRSVALALARNGVTAELTRDPAKIVQAKRLVIPGQGRFGTVACLLTDPPLRAAILDACCSKPVLAICVGMQLLFERSEEDPAFEGLGLIPGTVRRFEEGLRSPQMGWNTVEGPDWPESFSGDYYFAHSYWCDASQADRVVAWIDYGGKKPAVVQINQVIGVQFHPEKSGVLGRRVIKHFLEEEIC